MIPVGRNEKYSSLPFAETVDVCLDIVNQSVHYTMAESLDNILAAIADPTRRAILARLRTNFGCRDTISNVVDGVL
jgi:hypothetical protein